MTFCQLVCDALEDPILRILIVAAIVSLCVGMIEDPSEGWLEGTAILMAVVIVVMVTATNDYMKDKQFRALSAKADEVSVTVVRGTEREISAYDLVTGDIMRIKTGSIIPADGIVINCFNLKADESSKTGEPDLMLKGPFRNESNPKASPFLLAGSKIEEGSGTMLIGAVGINSSTGQTEELLQEDPEPTPLEVKLEKIADLIGTIGFYVALATFIVLVGYTVYDAVLAEAWGRESWHTLLSSFIIAITIIVVAVPEGLPLAVALSLAYSVGKMKEENNLVRHLQACETMGGATDVCTDKTGTLTQNRMTVLKLHVNGKTYENDELVGLGSSALGSLLINSFCVNSDASLVANADPKLPDEQKGSRTECAMIGLAKRWQVDYEQVRSKYASLNRVPFDSKWKWMASVADVEGERTIFLKGASERVIDLCEFINDQGQVQPFTTEQKEALKRDIVLPYARETLRTIGLAYRQDNAIIPEAFYHEDKMDESYVTSNMVFLGIVGIKDPIRPEVPKAVKTVQRAGVKVRMVTGDNVETAMAIAKECGILDKNFVRREGEYYVMEGNDFAKQVGGLEDDLETKVKVVSNMNVFRKIIPQLVVLARSAPEHKFILVTGLKQMDRVVAVTGDGSNDAPALKKSNVGFAMNIAGTQLAKDAADIILIDDNFASIVTALKWGRNIYDCIRKFIQFQITVNIVALTMCVVGAIFLHHSPLTAVQMLWVNLIMDTFAALALATEPPTEKLLKRKPYGKKESMINAEMKRQIVGAALYQISWLMVMLFLGPDIFGVEAGWASRTWTQEGGRHFTIFFNAFVFMQVFNEINCRKLKAKELNVFKGFCNNSLFIFIIVITIIAQILIVHFGGALLRCSRLTPLEHLYCIGIGMGSLVFIFLLKWFPAKVCTSWKLGDEEKVGAKGLNLLLRRDTTRSRATQQAFMKGMMRMKTK